MFFKAKETESLPMLFLHYLKDKKGFLFSCVLVFCLCFATLFLYRQNTEALIYAMLLCLPVMLIFAAYRFYQYVEVHRMLILLKKNPEQADLNLPYAKELIESDYTELVNLLCKKIRKEQTEFAEKARRQSEYFTLWTHQIKTPLAASRLLLDEEPPNRGALLQELFKTEQYVDMAMQYLRLDGPTNDMVIDRFELDAIVREAVRSLRTVFLYQKVQPHIAEINLTVLSDTKWLGFVLGQLLSNSLKYSKEGGNIFLYTEGDTLVIEDNGIGIDPEDLPRIFECGFTGKNGRKFRKATGIGLYLVKEILQKLRHPISVESEPGKGTKIRIDFSIPEVEIE